MGDGDVRTLWLVYIGDPRDEGSLEAAFLTRSLAKDYCDAMNLRNRLGDAYVRHVALDPISLDPWVPDGDPPPDRSP